MRRCRTQRHKQCDRRPQAREFFTGVCRGRHDLCPRTRDRSGGRHCLQDAPSRDCTDRFRWFDLPAEKQLNLSYMSLGATRRHTLGFFLEVMYRLGVEPAQFLAGTVSAEPNPVVSVAPCRTQRRFSPDELSEVGARVVARLDRAKSEKTRLTTRREFVRDVGISNSSFQAHFEEATRALREHNNLIRPVVHDALWERRSELISKAMNDLVERHGPFSAAAIGRALTQVGTHRRNPRVRKLAYEALLRAQANADGHHDIHSD